MAVLGGVAAGAAWATAGMGPAPLEGSGSNNGAYWQHTKLHTKAGSFVCIRFSAAESVLYRTDDLQ